MNEHLYKLKKDGKTVGYSHINHYGQLMFRLPNDEDWYCIGKFWPMMIEKYGFGICPCSYHPFVTKDKNGKDVFAGDKVKANGIIAIVKWDARECRYMLSTIPSLCEYPPALYDNMGSKFLWSDIELIEDKEDEKHNL